MNRRGKTWAWRAAKLLLALAILLGVGRQFYRDLTGPAGAGLRAWSELTLRPGWLALSGGLYLTALSFSAAYWYRLLAIFGHRPAFLKAYRAYFIGQLGKYVPGKAWALLLRGGLVAGPDVRLGVAIVTAFYEVLTTMSAGVLIAALVFLWAPPQLEELAWHPLFTGLLLLGLCGLPLMPGVFNFLTRRLARRVALEASSEAGGGPDAGPAQIGFQTLAEGILLTACGWLLLGISLWSVLRGVLPEPPALTVQTWLQYAADMGLAYVAGFLAFVIPSGVGVREYFLLHLLAGPKEWIAAAVLLLRLVWTTCELALAAVLFFMKGRRDKSCEIVSS
jgi:uncharacterized membrane protein YbhN (UPF0104 family)